MQHSYADQAVTSANHTQTEALRHAADARRIKRANRRRLRRMVLLSA